MLPPRDGRTAATRIGCRRGEWRERVWKERQEQGGAGKGTGSCMHGRNERKKDVTGRDGGDGGEEGTVVEEFGRVEREGRKEREERNRAQ